MTGVALPGSCAFFLFKQKTAYEMRISDWSSDVCSSDLHRRFHAVEGCRAAARAHRRFQAVETLVRRIELELRVDLRAVQRIDLLGQQGLVFLRADRGGLAELLDSAPDRLDLCAQLFNTAAEKGVGARDSGVEGKVVVGG